MSNHDVIRHATRYGSVERAKAATLTLVGLPGSPYLYEGEELGLEQDVLPPEARQDPIWVRSGGLVEGRDGCRTPLPWTAQEPGHGFTTGTPWLPFGPQVATRSVEVESADEGSTLAFYRHALQVRRQLRGRLSREVRWLPAHDGVLSYARAHADGGDLVCVLNTGEKAVTVPDGEVLVASSPRTALHGGAAVWIRTSHRA